MSIFRKLAQSWYSIWFKPESTTTVGLFRIILGAYSTFILVMSYPNWERFYGVKGILDLNIINPYQYKSSIFMLSSSDEFVWLVYWIGIISAIGFTLGILTDLFKFSLYVVIISMLHRNIYIVNGQDQVLGMVLFFCLFIPLGNSFSLDDLVKRFVYYGRTFDDYVAKKKSLWGAKLLQIGFAIIYLFAGPSKPLTSEAWRDGSAIYYVSLSERWFRFYDLPIFHNTLMSVFLTYMSVLIESAFAFWVWFRSTRYFALASIVLMHLGIMIVMSPAVFYFNAVMVVTAFVYIFPGDLDKLIDKFLTGNNYNIYLRSDKSNRNTVRLLKTIDGRNHLAVATSTSDKKVDQALKKNKLVLKRGENIYSGSEAIKELSGSILPLKLIRPFL